MSASEPEHNTQDEELLADLFDTLLQEILEGRTPDLDALHPDREDLRERIAKTWSLACSVAGRREPSRPVFGGYEIVRELGHGGMGTVYLARHQTLQRDVAVKVLPQSLAMSPRAKQRFVEEARSLAQLRHENVVHLHRIVDHSEMLAFEMEYVDGPSLQKLISELRKSERPYSIDSLAVVLGTSAAALGTRSAVEWFVRLLIKIGRALAEVHRHGLVHRDIKPANILLRSDGSPVLADFGLALPSDLDPKLRKFAGTAAYAAPERLRGDDSDASPVADVYSLGATLHEVLTLRPAYPGTTTSDVLRSIESSNVRAQLHRAPHISGDLATIACKAMEPDPRHRYRNADEMVDDLERLLNLQPIHAQPAGPVRRTFKFMRRHQKALLAATCGALLVSLVAWPLAAWAAEASENQRIASEALHDARTKLLCQESLPPWWLSSRSGRTVEQSQAAAPHLAALEVALQHYERAVKATPDDVALVDEANAVRQAVATVRSQQSDQSDSTAVAPTQLTQYGRGLYAFLTGDRARHRAVWQLLPAKLAETPFVDACTALGLATDGKAAKAYPRVFHAAREYPDATALVIAMANGALRSGDVAMARHWFEAIPKNGATLDRPRQLLAADLMAAGGDSEGAQRRYRQLSTKDPSDPRPLLRLVDLGLQTQNFDHANRLSRSILRRWPDLTRARRTVARLALQRHDVAEYLAHVRHVFGHESWDLDARKELLQLGGLQLRGLAPSDGTTTDAAVPLKTFLPAGQVRGIELALDILPTLHGIADLAAALDHRPVGSATLALGFAALRFPDLTAQLPRPLQAVVATLAVWRSTPVTYLSQQLLPYQTALGSRFHRVGDGRIFVRDARDLVVIYGNQVLKVEDLDGDTLPDLCVAAPPANNAGDPGYIELRRGDDGSLLTRWQDESPDGRMFGRSIADLGDADGDFCNDILIGAPLTASQSNAIASVAARSGRTGEVLWRITDDYGSFGAALAPIGDVDADGVTDFVVGAPPLRLTDPGRAQIRSGRNGQLLRELHAPAVGTWFGGTVTSAGDLTGDGRNDVLVGGNYGRAKGLVVAFDSQTGASILTVKDDNADNLFGHALVSVGDVDKDGKGDFAVSAPGDGPGSVAIISGHTGNSMYELRGTRSGERFGMTLCPLPDWRPGSGPALAIYCARGGPSGAGYVRVFDLKSGNPLQTFSTTGGILGYALVDLGDRDGDGLRDLGMMSMGRGGQSSLWSMSHADIVPSRKQPNPRAK